MPNTFPSDSAPFLKILESPLNLQMLFYITVFNDLTLEDLSKKMRIPDKSTIRESLDKMIALGLVEEQLSNGVSRFKTPIMRFYPKEYEEFKEFEEEKLREHLSEEFMYSYRMISLLKSIFGKLVHYICDFYISRMQTETLNTDLLKKELKYETAVPRVGLVSREEFEFYKTRFVEFENSLIDEMIERRKVEGVATEKNIEYIIANLFIPIKKVIDHK